MNALKIEVIIIIIILNIKNKIIIIIIIIIICIIIIFFIIICICISITIIHKKNVNNRNISDHCCTNESRKLLWANYKFREQEEQKRHNSHVLM